MKFRFPIKFLFSIIISFLIGWWAYIQSGSPEYQIRFNLEKWYMIPLLICLVVLGIAIRSWRLAHLFFFTYGKFRKIFRLLFFSLSFSFLLGGVGFLIRIFFLKKGIKSHHMVSLGYIGIEKLFDLILAFIVLFFLFTIPNMKNSDFSWLYENRFVVIISIMVSLIWFYFYHNRIFRFFLGVLKKIFQLFPFPLRYYYFGKRQVLYIYRSLSSIPPKKIIYFIGRSIIVFISESSFFYFSLKFLDIRIELEEALILNAIIILALLIPVLPSGIGLFQAAMVFVLGGNVFYASLLVHFFLIVTHLFIMTVGVYQFFDYLRPSQGKSKNISVTTP